MYIAILFYFFSVFISLIYRLKALVGFKLLIQEKRMSNSLDQKENLWLVMPCKGIDREMQDSLLSLSEYVRRNDRVKILFAIENREDKAYEFLSSHFCKDTILVTSDYKRLNSSLKNESLVRAIEKISEDGMLSDVVLFLDSDALVEDRIINTTFNLAAQGMFVTGYRSYAFEGTENWLAGSVVSSFSDELLVGQFIDKARFLWGGFMAATLQNWIAIDIIEKWQNSISDDCEATQGIKEKDLSIFFHPELLRESIFIGNTKQAFHFIKRQLQMVYLYRESAFLVFLLIKSINLIFFILMILNINWAFLFYVIGTMGVAFVQVQLNLKQSPKEKIMKVLFAPWHQLVISLAALSAFFDRNNIDWRGIHYLVDNSGKVIKRG